MAFHLSRRAALVGVTAALAGSSRAQPALPASPIALNIIDVAGNLQLTKPALERFRTENPRLVSRITYSQAPSPELPAKLRAQQDANRVDIDLVLTGPGALSDGVVQGLWTQLLPDFAAALPDLDAVFHPNARMMQQNFGKGQGIAVVYTPSGPLFEYAPDRVRDVPRTAADLLGWARAHPNRFFYARPYNSGPGWTFLQGLPYILGDADPKDPVRGWDKTWAYLSALNETIDYYPSGTGAMMKELGDGSRDMVVSTCGWDINPRVLGTVPKEVAVFMLEGTHWVPDTQFMCIPKGIAGERVAVLLRLMSFMLEPAQQAGTFDRGYFYPGPVVANVTLNAASAESRQVIAEFGRRSTTAGSRTCRPKRRLRRTAWFRHSGDGTSRSAPSARSSRDAALRRGWPRPPPHLRPVAGLIEAGLDCAGYWPKTTDPRVLEGFREALPAPARGLQPAGAAGRPIRLRSSSPPPSRATAPPSRSDAMRFGKDVLMDKPGVTTPRSSGVERTSPKPGASFPSASPNDS